MSWPKHLLFPFGIHKMYMATLSAGCFNNFVLVNPFLTAKHLLFPSINTCIWYLRSVLSLRKLMHHLNVGTSKLLVLLLNFFYKRQKAIMSFSTASLEVKRDNAVAKQNWILHVWCRSSKRWYILMIKWYLTVSHQLPLNLWVPLVIAL